jgi:hypothetical protein
VLKGGKHYNFVCVWCWNVFPDDRMPLQHCTIEEEVDRNELANLALIRDAGTSAGARRPWLGRRFVVARNQCKREGRDRKEEGGKWRR